MLELTQALVSPRVARRLVDLSRNDRERLIEATVACLALDTHIDPRPGNICQRIEDLHTFGVIISEMKRLN